MDNLSNYCKEDAIAEIIKLRTAIRLHRDEKGHDRCWLDDQRLYQVLPESVRADFRLPEHDEFIENCEKFWKDRNKP